MNLTFWHAMIVSLALHSALVLPFMLPQPEPPEEPPILVVELMGIEAPTQSEEKIQQQTKGQDAPQQPQAAAPETPPTPQVQQPTPAPEEPQEVTSEDGIRQQAEQKQQESPPQQQPSPPAPASTGNTGSANVEGEAEQKKAQTLAAEQAEETERLRIYLRRLTKKVQENLLYPDAGRKGGLKGTASVAFTLQADGAIAPGTLRIETGSGQTELDVAAMKTVEASAPFEAPPRVISIAISVVYGKVASGAKRR